MYLGIEFESGLGEASDVAQSPHTPDRLLERLVEQIELSAILPVAGYNFDKNVNLRWNSNFLCWLHNELPKDNIRAEL